MKSCGWPALLDLVVALSLVACSSGGGGTDVLSDLLDGGNLSEVRETLVPQDHLEADSGTDTNDHSPADLASDLGSDHTDGGLADGLDHVDGKAPDGHDLFVDLAHDIGLDLADSPTADDTDSSLDAGSDSDSESPPACPMFEEGTSIATVMDPDIGEASGLAVSRSQANVFWVHNDSGDSARLFALSNTGSVLGRFSLSGVQAIDWEDMAIGPNPFVAGDFLYIGDMGDNTKTRPNIIIYRVPEPILNPEGVPESAEITVFDAFSVKYPNGLAFDCEALMVDPNSGRVFLATKEGEMVSSVYAVDLPASPPAEALVAELVGQVPMFLTTAGDISPDGRLMVLRSYFEAKAYPRPEMDGALEDWSQVLTHVPCPVEIVIEKQGETLAFGPDGLGYYSLSEGIGQPLYYYPKVIP